MAYVVARKTGAWEIRESQSTEAGPRSRTLATFKTLTPEVIAHAQARSSKPLDASELRRVARRAGAPVALSGIDRAAGELLAELGAGRRPRPMLARLLAGALQDERDVAAANAEAAAAWITATPTRRGDTLRDLLLLVDHLPRPRAPRLERFPRIASSAP